MISADSAPPFWLRHAARALVLCTLVACGGKVYVEDGGLDGSVWVEDAATMCTDFDGGGVFDLDAYTCSFSASWSCNAVNYGLQCTCPAATCNCITAGVSTVISVSHMCAGCSKSYGDVALLCGAPFNNN